MHQRSLFLSALLMAVALIPAGPICRAQSPAAAAQNSTAFSVTPTAANPPAVGDPIQALIQDGRSLEGNGRWVEALSHYDKAVREHGNSPELKQRRTLAHIHVDLNRRAVDSSFERFTEETSSSQATATLREICEKIQRNYVGDPDWQRVAWRGTASVDVAVTKDFFRERHCPQATNEQISDFRHVLRSHVNKRSVRTSSEVADLANYAAELAKTQLGVRESAVLAEYCTGAVAALDVYSTYLTEDQLTDVYSQIDGNFVGLGIELKATQNALRIIKVIKGGPAERAGLLADDLITAVDGQETETISSEKAADLLKGEQGSEVAVRIENAAGVRTVRVTRDRVDVPCIETAHIIDKVNGIAYFKLTSFQKTTSRDVDETLWMLHRDGMRSLIVDVRGNPGGLLTASVEVADKFVEEGIIVSTRGRSVREDFDYKAHRVGTWRVPLVVLIDEETASASEIFSGAIHDHHRGTIVGTRSYGKGSVQGIFPLGVTRSGVRLTTAKFFSPSGQAISHQGVKPHWEVAATSHVVGKPVMDENNQVITQADASPISKDPVISAAIEAARKMAVARR